MHRPPRPRIFRSASSTACIAILISVAATTALSSSKRGAADDTSATPVLIELFTSEGCSSCPPADSFLEALDSRQPVKGVQLIVLSEHVDYWNHDGWTDRFSSASITDRQNNYVHALHLNTPYTPQFLVDGSAELRYRDTQDLLAKLQQAASSPKITLRFILPSIAPGNSVVQGHIETAENGSKNKAEVYVAVALDHAESQVASGENSGRHMTHVAVVTDIAKIGKLESGKNFSQDFRIKLKLPASESKTIRLVAFAQENGPGKVLGVTLAKLTLE